VKCPVHAPSHWLLRTYIGMAVKHPGVVALSEIEARWPQTSTELIDTLDLSTSNSQDFKRLDSLYRRCLMCVPGFQEKQIELSKLHDCILAAIQTIEHKWPNVNCQDLRAGLMPRNDLDDEMTERAINIAVCLWLGVDCVGPKHSMPKNWPELDSIHHFVLNRRFDDPTETSIGDTIFRFPPKFRAARLEDISGISIESTYYLDQHLRFNEDTRTVKVFMDAVWLQSMCKRFRQICEAPRQGLPPSSSSAAPGTAEQKTPAKQAPECEVHARSLATDKRISLDSGSCGMR
jgi:hypothetical protein